MCWKPVERTESNQFVDGESNKNYCRWIHTCKSLTNALISNQMAISVVGVTFGKNLINRTQVQVDSIMQVECQSPILLCSTAYTTVSARYRLFRKKMEIHFSRVRKCMTGKSRKIWNKHAGA